MAPLGGPHPGTWNRLAERARNLFGTHTWAHCWWQVYGDGGTPKVLVDDPVDPRVILPMYTSGRLLRQLRFIGHGPADQLGPVCAPGDSTLAAPLLRAAIADGELAADVLLLQDMPVADPWWSPLGARRISTEQSPVLEFTEFDSWEAFLATKSRNFRGQAVRKPRRLEKAHKVTYRLADADTLERDLDDLWRLHAARWDGGSPLLDDRFLRFIATFCDAALERDWLRLWMLDVDDETVSALLVFRFGEDEYCYQFGRDPAWDSESVGFVLLVHAIAHALDTGAREFRFLRGDEDYKGRFASREADIETRAVPAGLRGRAAIWAAQRRRKDVAA